MQHASLVLLFLLTMASQISCMSKQGHGSYRKNCFVENPQSSGTKVPNFFVRDPEKPISALSVNGPCIVDDSGTSVILRGVSIADPEHLERKRGEDSSIKVFQNAVTFGATVIRIPMHKGEDPGWGLASGHASYLDTYIDPLIAEAKRLGVYIIIDLHIIDEYLKEKDFVTAVWVEAAQRYGNIPNVIFELFNEPTFPDSWSVWKHEFVVPVLSELRKYAPHSLVIVGSPHWSVHLAEALQDPVELGPVAYTAHIYPEIPEYELKKNYHALAGRLPLFVTEWGFNEASEYPMRGSRTSFGEPLISWMTEYSLSWTAWIYDSQWGQSIVNEDWLVQPGGSYMGELVREQLHPAQ